MTDKKCMKCGSLVPPGKMTEDFTRYKCTKCGQEFAVINTVKYPHGV